MHVVFNETNNPLSNDTLKEDEEDLQENPSLTNLEVRNQAESSQAEEAPRITEQAEEATTKDRMPYKQQVQRDHSINDIIGEATEGVRT